MALSVGSASFGVSNSNPTSSLSGLIKSILGSLSTEAPAPVGWLAVRMLGIVSNPHS